MSSAIPLPVHYFRWLCRQISLPVGEEEFTYKTVYDVMHHMPFRVLVIKDDNRVADARQLRNSFLLYMCLEPLDDDELHDPPVSVFEVLVALALRAERLIEIRPGEMFKIFLQNLKLTIYHDKSDVIGIRLGIHKNIRRFNDRRYTARGTGGIFPLKRTHYDQTKVELWYQMGAYMTENKMY
jgi:hypothetical protein